MEIGIFGLPQSGKTTLFNLLTSSNAETGMGAGKKKANVGISRVPDPRLDKLIEIWSPQKSTYATIQYVDVAGVESSVDKGLASETLTSLKNTDALLLVVRDFADDSIPHSDGTVDAVRDALKLTEELLLSDLVIAETRLERMAKQMKGKSREEIAAETAVMEKVRDALEAEKPLRELEFSADELNRIKGFQFLTLKPVIVALNVSEDDLSTAEEKCGELTGALASESTAATYICATIEQEISELSEEDAAVFMEDLGLTDSATDRIIRTSYELLGLMSFFTHGEDECRAWTIRKGSKAPRAAGAIHSDLEHGFIRAEVVGYDDFVEAGSLAACRDKGLLRVEGKEYIVDDGDILNIRFNV
jgi:GTP-binding protein YchF